MEILSERSSRVVSYGKLRRASVRREQGRFLVEGANSVLAAIQGGHAREVLIPVGEEDRHRDLLDEAHAHGTDILGINARAAVKLAETSSPTGVFAVCGLLGHELAAVLAGSPQLVAVAVEARDPGNVGTLIRCADAMGADAVVLLGDSVDPHNGKCVRSSAGSVFHLPIAVQRSTSDGLTAITNSGLSTFATAADGELSLDDADEALAARVAWLFGNEAHGLDDAVAAQADHRVSIPIRGRAESLNLAAAAAICLYASARVHAAR